MDIVIGHIDQRNNHKIRLFVASSYEIKTIREQILLCVAAKNKTLEPQDVQIETDLWEFESGVVPASGRSQNDYNALLGKADMAAIVLKNKVGQYTAEEFEKALERFKTIGKPKTVVFTLPPDNAEESLEEFRSLLRNMECFPVETTNVDNLWNKIDMELDRVINALKETRVRNIIIKNEDYKKEIYRRLANDNPEAYEPKADMKLNNIAVLHQNHGKPSAP